MEWTVESSDLNLMELDELDRRVNAKQSTSANLCENFWNRSKFDLKKLDYVLLNSDCLVP